MQLFFFKREKEKLKTRDGRPRIVIHGSILEKGMYIPTRTFLSEEQKRIRKVLAAQYSRAKKHGKDTSKIISEMEKLGGIPKSWHS